VDCAILGEERAAGGGFGNWAPWELTFPMFSKFSTKFGRFSGPTWANYTPIHSLGRLSDIFRAHHSQHFLYFLIVSTKHLGVQIARRGRVIRTGGFVQRRPVHAPGNG